MECAVNTDFIKNKNCHKSLNRESLISLIVEGSSSLERNIFQWVQEIKTATKRKFTK